MRKRWALTLVVVTGLLIIALALGFALLHPAGAPIPMHP